MKKIIVLGIVAVMVMGLTVAANATIDDTWVMQLRAYNGAATPLAGVSLIVGTKVGANDVFTTTGSEDATLAPPTGTPGVILSDIFTMCKQDYRAPLTTVGQTKTWDLSMYVIGGGAQNMRLDGWMATSANALTNADGGATPWVSVKLMQGANVLWEAPYGVSGTQNSPTFRLNFPEYNGGVVDLQVVATVVQNAPPVTTPEPGSMLAMFSGLVGLVGFGIRRRK